MRLPHLRGRPPTHITELGKGGRDRRLPLTPRARAAIGEYLPVRAEKLRAWGSTSYYLWILGRLLPKRMPGPVWLSRAGVGEPFDRLLTDAGIRAPGFRAHVLRTVPTRRPQAMPRCDLRRIARCVLQAVGGVHPLAPHLRQHNGGVGAGHGVAEHVVQPVEYGRSLAEHLCELGHLRRR